MSYDPTAPISSVPTITAFASTNSLVVDDGSLTGGRGTPLQLLTYLQANDGSSDLLLATQLSAIPSGLLLFGIQSDGTLVRVPSSLLGTSGGASTATTFIVAASPASIAIGSTATLTVTPGTGGWPSGEVVTAVATTVTGTFDAATKTGTGTTPVTFTFTATGSAATGSLSATAPGMTLSGTAAALATTGSFTAGPSFTFSGTPVYNTAAKFGSNSVSNPTGSVALTLPSSAASIGFFFKGAAGFAGPGSYNMFASLHFGSNYAGWSFDGSGNLLAYKNGNGGAGISPNTNVRDGAWHWLLITVSTVSGNTTCQFYVDGTMVYSSLDNTFVMAPGSATFNFNAANAASADAYDELVTYDGVASATVPTTAIARTSSTVPLALLHFDGNGTGS